MEGRQREAVIIWQGTCGSPPLGGRAHRDIGIGGSPRQCAINLKRGLSPIPIYGWGRGGIWRKKRKQVQLISVGRKAEGDSPHRTDNSAPWGYLRA